MQMRMIDNGCLLDMRGSQGWIGDSEMVLKVEGGGEPLATNPQRTRDAHGGRIATLGDRRKTVKSLGISWKT